jgi:hypothetical protein
MGIIHLIPQFGKPLSIERGCDFTEKACHDVVLDNHLFKLNQRRHVQLVIENIDSFLNLSKEATIKINSMPCAGSNSAVK